MDNKIKVLMTGAGAPGGPGIIKALSMDSNIELHVADMNTSASGSNLVDKDKFHTLPKADDENFIPHILEVCKKHRIDVVFPLVTMELFQLSQYKREFLDLGIRVIVSDYDSIEIVNNKCKLYSHMKQKGIAVPNFFTVTNKQDLENTAKELNYPEQPIVMKPCISNGSRGVRVLDPRIDRFEMLFDHKPNALFSSLNEILQIIGDREIPPLMLCEYLPGDEITIDTLVKEGEMVECLLRKRNTMNNGISTSGSFIESKPILQYIEQIIRSVPGLDGPVGFQVKQSKDGEYLLLESNPRIQGTSVAALGLDINLPLLAVYLSLGRAYPYLNKKKHGVSFSRYYSEIFYES